MRGSVFETVNAPVRCDTQYDIISLLIYSRDGVYEPGWPRRVNQRWWSITP